MCGAFEAKRKEEYIEWLHDAIMNLQVSEKMSLLFDKSIANGISEASDIIIALNAPQGVIDVNDTLGIRLLILFERIPNPPRIKIYTQSDEDNCYSYFIAIMK